MRTLCASTLIAEIFVIGFAGLVAMKSDDLAVGTVWTVCGVAMVLCLLLCGMITRPGGVQLGWALQIALVASGVAVPAMFALGAIFAALWWASVHYGRAIDQAKARWAEQAEAQERAGSGEQAQERAPGQASAEADAV
ncbi:MULTISPECIES: DUF4233 domain-containing protein [unclassified Streptomyces]|uniref:DUF4233 domain-containing protein n=1 Tax=unclassified Streptomyces TaxID=2593676 RepID=UPI00081DA370|nr:MULTISPECIES: DUF4233 domain-containing protein [unclassified Streptomyces]MYZ37608.1 DUF4233 domain-containing protein [Streptomyces sp. SID4917]SCF92612.1 Protein of unknown function [Streptomyces sp. MnatMP-M17]